MPLETPLRTKAQPTPTPTPATAGLLTVHGLPGFRVRTLPLVPVLVMFDNTP
jgi:hypothetical protein